MNSKTIHVIYGLLIVIILGTNIYSNNRKEMNFDEEFINLLIEASNGLSLDYKRSEDLQNYYYDLVKVNIYAAYTMIDNTSYEIDNQNLKSFLGKFSQLMMDDVYKDLIISYSFDYNKGIRSIINNENGDIEEVVQELNKINSMIKLKIRKMDIENIR